MSGFDPPHYSYGGGAGRYTIFEVVDRDDPEQAGRLKVRAFGWQNDKGRIPDEDLHWARMVGSPHLAQNKGAGSMGTGAMKGSYMMGYYTADQQPVFTGSLNKSEGENGGFDGTNNDLNMHSRDERRGGGDKRYVRKDGGDDDGDYGDKSILEYAIYESPNQFGKKTPKEYAEDDDDKAWSLAMHEYA